MDISLLNTFREIYTLRHFRKAAEKLCITQSAASARIKSLEDKLGTQLFYRDKGTIEPTPAGHRFIKFAEQMIASWEQAKQTVGLPEEYAEVLSVGFIADIWHMFLNTCIEDVRSSMPHLALNLTIHPGPSIHELLITKTIDLGFVFEPLKLSALVTEPVRSVCLKLYTTDKGTVLDDAITDNYIMVDWGTAFTYEHAQNFKDSSSVSVKTNYGVMAFDMLKRGGGAAYLPYTVAKEAEEELPLFAVKDAPEFNREIYAVYRRDSSAIDSFNQVISIVKRD